jgi:hypothetical protein
MAWWLITSRTTGSGGIRSSGNTTIRLSQPPLVRPLTIMNPGEESQMQYIFFAYGLLSWPSSIDIAKRINYRDLAVLVARRTHIGLPPQKPDNTSGAYSPLSDLFRVTMTGN